MANQRLGPFELEEKIGAGGMGVVYRARYEKTGQQVALKLLTPAFSGDEKLIARFQRELEILKKLKHPNIVQCFGGGRLGEQRFYVMELIEGGSLAEILRRKGRLAWEESLQHGIQICEALQHAHENGIVHRDLKPGNLMLDKQGRVKLADFGLARVTDATAITAAGKTLGTFAYMAPEQITGNSPISPKTDLYALGCVLYEFLTGETPFKSETASQLFYEHLQKKPPRVCQEVLDCPLWLEAIILQLLEKEPEKRPRDALAVAQALREVQQKVAANEGIIKHSFQGEPTAISVETDLQEVGKLLKKKKKKKRDKQAEFYEQTWFLVTCLLLLVGGVTWAAWPLNEEQLFQRANPLMASEDPVQWREARDKYLDPLRKRFPEGRHAAEVQEFVDRIEMQQAEDRIKNRIKRGLEPEGEAERLFADAWKFELFGDRITALEKYRGMEQVLKDRAEDRPFANLARRHIAQINQAGGDANDRLKIVDEALAKAERFFENGNVLEARKTWDSIVTLYAQNRELEPQVKRARDRLAGKVPQPLQNVPAESTAPPSVAEPIANEAGPARPEENLAPEGTL
jgi:serine/threonine-protein kinase